MRQAAHSIGRSPGHVYLVLTGKRESQPTLDALSKLPKRPLSLRRKPERAIA